MMGMAIPGTAKGVSEAADEAVQGIRAYHGSPHDFDKFDLSKIGTGEGAQAYGHGLYFAESEGVAKSYRDALAKRTGEFKMADGTSFSPKHANTGIGLNAILDGQSADDWANWSPEEIAADPAVSEIIEALKQHGPPTAAAGQAGKMYEVRINANPDDFLDWDKPLSEQSAKVRDVFAGVAPKTAANPRGDMGYMLNEASNEIAEIDGSWGQAASKANITPKLREAGIPGIKYLDQGSRTSLQADDLVNSLADYDRQIANAQKQIATMPENFRADYQGEIDRLTRERAAVKRKAEPSRNYVAFDDNLIEIVRKYGIAGLLAGGGGLMAAQQQQPRADGT
jgi:hypothetical protein